MSESREEPDAKRRKLSAASVSASKTESSVGSQQLQAGFNIVEFAECRARELIAMSKISRKVSGNKAPQQIIPRHMRRRAASHHIKRLPRRLREAALRENMRNPRAVNKRPSRKHRRRPSNLLKEYLRRQRSKKWLETHIWHAKRFHMTEKWGYKLALHPNDKGARASYRASVKHCLLQDLSFLTCVEIRGEQSSVAEKLNRLTSKDVGLRFGAAAYKKGQREGSIVVYEADMYPYGAIGPVQFMWKPKLDNSKNDGESVLWIWVHPAILNVLLKNILTVLDISPVSVDVNANKQNLDNTTQESQNSDKIRTSKDLGVGSLISENSTNSSLGKTNVVKKEGNNSGTEATNCAKSSETKLNSTTERDKCDNIGTVFTSSEFGVKLLSNELCRFQLTGPLSQVVLARTLEAASVLTALVGEIDNGDISDEKANDRRTSHSDENKNDKQEEEMKVISKVKTENDENNGPLALASNKVESSQEGRKWWQTYHREDNALHLHEQQKLTWQQAAGLLSPAELQPHCVLGLTVTDPRLQLPAKRGKTYPNIEDWNTECTSDKITWTPDLSYSPLWENEIRREVMETKMSEQQMNKLRSNLLVPGSTLELGDEASRIPIVLIQHPGHQPPEGAGAGRTGLGCGWDIILPARWAMAFWIPFVYRGARVCGLKDSSVLCASQGVLHFPSYYPDTAAGQRYQSDIAAEQKSKYNRKPPAKRTNYLRYGVAAPFEPPWRELVANWVDNQNEGGASKKNEQPAAGKEDSQRNFYVLRCSRTLRALGNLCHPVPRKSMSVGDSNLIAGVLEGQQYKTALVPVHVEMCTKGLPGAMSMICIPTEEDLKNIQGTKNLNAPEESRHKIPKFSTKAKTKAKTKQLKVKLSERREEERRNRVAQIRNSCSREIAGFVSTGGFDLSSGYGTGIGFITVPALKPILALKEGTEKRLSAQRPIVLIRNATSLKYRYATINVFQSSLKLC